MTLSIGQILAVSITATAASIGAAGIPQEHFQFVGLSGGFVCRSETICIAT
jgi:hypothetical protein